MKQYIQTTILTITAILLSVSLSFGQMNNSDSSAVRSILDTNFIIDATVSDVVTTKNGRVNSLFLIMENLEVLPSAIGNLTELELLYLFLNNLVELPEELGNCTKLSELRLSDNQLETLPMSSKNWSNLMSLDISRNMFSEIPASVWTFSKLKSLSVSSNFITKLPSSIGSLTSLTELRVDNNQLTSLPDDIGNAKGITSLDLSYNQLTTLPASIINLKPTEHCDLGHNKLTNLTPEQIKWADTYDPDWKSTQDGTMSMNNTISFTTNNAIKVQTIRGQYFISLPVSGKVAINIFQANGKKILSYDGIFTKGQLAPLPTIISRGTGIVVIQGITTDKRRFYKKTSL